MSKITNIEKLINFEVIKYENIGKHVETEENKKQRYWVINKIVQGLQCMEMIWCQIKNG